MAAFVDFGSPRIGHQSVTDISRYTVTRVSGQSDSSGTGAPGPVDSQTLSDASSRSSFGTPFEASRLRLETMVFLRLLCWPRNVECI